jgi:FkbM family methyltransferase
MAIHGIRTDFNEVRELGGLNEAIRFAFAKILRQPSTVQITIDGLQINVRPNSPDLHVAEKTIRAGEFNAAIKIAAPLKHNFIIDAGGYIGTVSIVLARIFPEATIVTVEPSRENFAILQKNVAPFRNVVPLNAALGPKAGRQPFYDHGDGPWGYSLLNKTASQLSTKALHDIEIVTIPGIIERFRASGVDFLKLDIEGYEKELLSDCPPWVSKVRVIAAELHDWVQEGCEAAFAAAMTGRVPLEKDGELSISVARG